MNLLPNIEKVKIPIDKLTKYSLDPLCQPDKSRAFRLALGYDKTNYQSLIEQIMTNVLHCEAKPKGDIGYGMRYEVIMKIKGVNEKTASVLTAWIDDVKSGEMRLTNVYVDKPKGGIRSE